LKIEKGLKERSGRYVLGAMPFFICVNLRGSAVKFLLTLCAMRFAVLKSAKICG
jgi:hypothetical protein